jgi:diguanylate cyclase (GGDEF)-like protein
MQGLRAGGDDFIVKPATPALLLTAVASHLERARLLRSYMERDGLTRLLTHSAFLDRLREAYDRSRRRPEHHPVLVMMDLDAFKAVNDRFGHAVGDRVLMAFASLLRQRVRHSDVVGRYGGEEFALLIEALDEADALRLSERLRQDFAATDQVAPDGTRFRVTLSAGVAALDAAATSFEGWKKAADDALYRAKAEGRNRVLTAPQPMRP